MHARRGREEQFLEGAREPMFMELMSVAALANATNRLANGLRVPVDARFQP